MNKKGFISISVVYTLFMLFIMLLLAVLAGYANMRVLLRIAKGDTSDILVDSEDNRQVGVACRQQKIGECFASFSNLDHDLNYHDGNEIDSGSELEAGDNSYRYSGNNPFNYVCFGTAAETCPEDNLYRIIGIFDGQAKLIKNKPLSVKQAWDSGNKTYWPDTSLYNYLNTEFYNNTTFIAKDWQQKIAKTAWNIGEADYAKIVQSNAKTAYEYEIGAKKTDMTVEAKIGLMYISDYYYAASPEYWAKKGLASSGSDDYRASAVNNWLAGHNEWTITPVENNQKQAFKIFKAGYAGADYVITSTNYEIRPVFYLYNTVSLISGIGTEDDPFLIN